MREERGRETLREWSERHPSVRSWLRLRRRSWMPITSILRGFIEWLSDRGPEALRGLGPEGLVEFQQGAAGNSELYLVSEAIIDYILANERWREGYRHKVVTSIRGFFKSNKAQLPANEDEALAMWTEETPPAAPEYLTLEIAEKVIRSCSLIYRTIFSVMFSSGMGVEETLSWSRQGVDGLYAALGSPACREHGVVLIPLPPRKKTGRRSRSLPYHTALGGSALEYLRRYIKAREGRKESYEREHPGERYPNAIFVSNINTPLEKSSVRSYWHRHLLRVGAIEKAEEGYSGNRYGMGCHQLRDLFRNQAPLAKRVGFDSDVSEFMMGHTSQLDPNKYLNLDKKPEYVVEEYLKLLPYVDIESDLVWGRIDVKAYQEQKEELDRVKKTLAEVKERGDLILGTREDFASVLRTIAEIKRAQEKESAEHKKEIAEHKKEIAEIRRQLREREGGG